MVTLRVKVNNWRGYGSCSYVYLFRSSPQHPQITTSCYLHHHHPCHHHRHTCRPTNTHQHSLHLHHHTFISPTTSLHFCLDMISLPGNCTFVTCKVVGKLISGFWQVLRLTLLQTPVQRTLQLSKYPQFERHLLIEQSYAEHSTLWRCHLPGLGLHWVGDGRCTICLRILQMSIQ